MGDRGGGLDIGHYDFEDQLWQATADDGKPRRMVYTVPKPMVVLGRGSKPDIELNLDECSTDAVTVLRRRGGGCSVVLDPGNVLVAASLAAEGIGDNLAYFNRLNRWLLKGLESIGEHRVQIDGISDLVIGDRKIGGTCIYRARGVLLYSASLLVEPDLTLIDRYLRHPPREPGYRRGRAHREFLTTIADGESALSAEYVVRLLNEELPLLDARAL